MSIPHLSQISAKLEPENVVVIAAVWHNALGTGPADSAGDVPAEGPGTPEDGGHFAGKG